MPHPHVYPDDGDLVVAATRWLLTRYATRPDNDLARLIRSHLDWLALRPDLASANARLASDWRRLGSTTGAAPC